MATANEDLLRSLRIPTVMDLVALADVRALPDHLPRSRLGSTFRRGVLRRPKRTSRPLCPGRRSRSI